jgi:hypothetical protein
VERHHERLGDPSYKLLGMEREGSEGDEGEVRERTLDSIYITIYQYIHLSWV